MSEPIIVAAFDIGTTYSGWAYSFKTDNDAKPAAIMIMQPTGGLQSCMSKVPTSLFIPDEGYACFGYIADRAYENYCVDDREDFMYLSRFKMILNQRDLNDETVVEAVNNTKKKQDISTVLRLSRHCLLKDFHNTIKQRFININLSTDILYTITVPAIWTDSAKQIMRRAAVKAGIQEDKLILALEPEACSLVCRSLHSTITTDADKSQIVTIPEGTKYIVVDAGGGTIDVAVHEVIRNDKLREVYYASGGGWGGTLIDDAFKEMLSSILANNALEQFQRVELEDYMTLVCDWETKKRMFTSEYKESKKTSNIKLPTSLLSIHKELANEELSISLTKRSSEDDIVLKKCTLRLSSERMQALFSDTISKTIDHLKKLLDIESIRNVSLIFMAGGLSECDLFTTAAIEAFPDRKIVVPPDASLCTLKGAVMYGHSILKYKKTSNVDDLIIKQRVSKYTYGYDISVPFIYDKHPYSKHILTDEGFYCKDIFKKVIEIGQTVDVETPLPSISSFTLHHNQKSVCFNLSASDKKDHIYTDDEGCRQIGKLRIILPDPEHSVGREIEIMFTFGGTELKVSAKDVKTGHQVQCQLDVMSIEKKMTDMCVNNCIQEKK